MVLAMAPVMFERTITTAFVLWAIGVVANEALASVGMGLCVAAVLVQRAWPWRAEGWVDGLRAWWPLWVFVLWGFVGPLFAGRLPSGTGAARLFDWVAIPIAASAWPAVSTRSRERAVWSVAAVFAISCVVAGFQHFGVWPSASFFESWSWTRIPFQRVYEPVPSAPDRFMAGGLIFHRLKFAHVGGLAVLLGLVLSVRAGGWRRHLGLGVVGLGAVAVMAFPFARSATIALLASLPVALVLAWGRKKWALVCGAVLVLAGAGVLALRPAARERFLSSLTAKGSGDREFLRDSGVRAVQAFPLTGVGAGRFRVVDFASADAPQYVKDNAGKAHNQLLSVAAELGIAGLMFFCGALVWLALRMKPASLERAVGLTALVYFLVLSIAHDPLFQAPFSMALVFVLSFATASMQEQEERVLKGAQGKDTSSARA